MYDRNLIAHKLVRWEKFMQKYTLPEWEAIPDFGLYMEQVVTYLCDVLCFVPTAEEPKERMITASAINNYVRLKLMPPPVKKRYYRLHIAYLIMIFTLKQSLSIQDIQRAIPANLTALQVETLYKDYIERFRQVGMLFTAQARTAAQGVLNPEGSSDAAITSLAVLCALFSGFSRILAEKLLRLQDADSEEVLRLEQEGQHV